MPRLFGQFEVILACSVIISAIFISFFLSKPQINQILSSPSPTPMDGSQYVAQHLPSPSGKPLPDWITYNNPSNRFSLRYPQDWSIIEEEDLAASAHIEITSGNPSTVFILYNEKSPFGLDIKPDISETVYFDKQPVTHRIFTMSQESTVWHSYTFINNPSYSIEARIHPIDKETFDRILSTFRFIPPN